MPNRLPIKPRAKAMRVDDPSTRRTTVRARERDRGVDWLGLWAISLGISATVFAWIVYFTTTDKIGASFILAGTAALIALLLSANERGLF